MPCWHRHNNNVMKRIFACAPICSPTPSSGRLLGLALVALASAGCKTEKDPDQPTLLGAPPTTAYLGVEYYYNWGAYGGESILDYSLTNAPSWLALEDTSNKARQGIIMRGVPGLSGGTRGEADLGRNDNIDLVTTDGRMAGFQPFDIEVKRNLVSLEVPNLKEGESPEIPATRRQQCALPDLGEPGSHTFQLNQYAADGSAQGTREVTYQTSRAFVRVILDQPSVTRVKIAFELDSEFDENACEEDDQSVGDQGCDFSRSNLGRARLGQDIVIKGSGSDHAVDEQGEQLDYIAYEEPVDGAILGGVITLEPGITECYIPLEIVDDTIPEPSEIARIRLTEVREGIASLGSANTGIQANLTIADNEPVVALETLNQGPRDTINVGASSTYRATLTGDRDNDVWVRLTSEILPDINDFTITQTSPAEDDDYTGQGQLFFPLGTDSVEFDVSHSGDVASGSQDRAIQLKVDQVYQAGRENYARGESEDLLRVNFNRLELPLTWNDSFTPTDIAIGQEGRLFVAGFTSEFKPVVRVCEQVADRACHEVVILDDGLTEATDVYIDVAERSVTEGSRRTTRYEVAVAFSTGDSAGEPAPSGQKDVVVGLYRYDSDASSYNLRWNQLYRLGTSGDDQVRWVGLNRGSGYVAVAGETNGTWEGEVLAGGTDVFLARIDTTPDGVDLVPGLTWVRQAGSSGNDQAVGGSVESLSPLVFGQAAGTLDGLANTGPFFFSGSASGALNIKQIGEGTEEVARDGFFGEGNAWLIGDGRSAYSVRETEGEDNELVRTPGNSLSGFALGFTTAGVPVAALNANDQNDNARVRLTRGLLFNSDIVVAGDTDGTFEVGAGSTGNDGILARLSRGGDEAYRNWRSQLAEFRFLKLANYRGDKLVALVERNNGDRELRVFSPEGVLLN